MLTKLRRIALVLLTVLTVSVHFVYYQAVNVVASNLTLRPNGAGSETNITGFSGAPTHWETVDEVSPDDFTSSVYSSFLRRDLYALDNSGQSSPIINSVTVYARVYSMGGGPDAGISIRTNGVTYDDTMQNLSDAVWTNINKAYTTNPNTSQAWTWTQIDALEAGIRLINSSEVGLSYCTQVYVVVGYTILTAPTITISAATNVEATTATLNGSVTATGGENPTVTVYWGTTNGGTNPASWQNSGAPTSPGQPQGVASFYKNVGSLATGTTYYFSAKATNSGGTGWPAASLSFLTKPAAPTNVAATDGTYTDKVTITWTKSTGATHYIVYRATTNISGTLGDVATYDDTGADAPTITPGAASASDGLYISYVTLTLSGQSTSNGTTHTYKVVANNASGNSADSTTNTGYRGVGALTFQWQISAADSDSNYSNIGGATTNPYDDTGIPVGVGRYYKCVLNAAGAAQQISTSDRGYRKAPGRSYGYIFG